MYNGQNLLKFAASSQSKYTNGLMKILFTEQELAVGYIIEGPSTSTRTPLDNKRIYLLKGKILNN